MRELLDPGAWGYWLSKVPFRAFVFLAVAALAVPVARAEGLLGGGYRGRGQGDPGTKTRLTKLGWGVIGVSLLTLMAAGSTGNNLLYLLYGACVASLLVSVAAGWPNLRGVSVEPEAPGQVFRGAQFALRLSLRREGRWPAFGLEAVLGASKAAVAVLRAARPAEVELKARAEHRGWNDLSGLVLESRFPFGLIVWRRRLSPPKVLALPRLREVHGASEVRAQSRSSGRPTLRKGSGDELYGIRAYDPGDDIRKINWKVSAKLGRPLINEFCEAQDSKITVSVPASSGEDAERRIEEAASACRFYIDSGVEVRLVTPESEVDFGKGLLHLDRLLAALALLGDGRRARVAAPGPPLFDPLPAESAALRRATLATAFLVYAAVYLVDDVDWRVWALMLPLLPLGLRVQETRSAVLPDWLWRLMSLSVLAFTVLVDWPAHGVVVANTHLLMYLLANRLLNPFAREDLRQTFLILFLAFFLVSGLTISPWYFAFFMAYLALCASWLFLAAGLAWERRKDWAPALAGWGAASLALSILVFLATPRVEGLRRINPILAGLDKFQAKASVTTGFTENISLGWFGELKRSSARVMRVEPASPPVGRPGALRIRGAAYDLFDGTSWKKELVDFRYRRGRRRQTSTGGRGWAQRRGRELRLPTDSSGATAAYRFSLFPMGLTVVFTVGSPWFVGGIDDNSYFDYTDSLYVATPYFTGLKYVAFSGMGPNGARVGLIEFDESLRSRYLALPPDPNGRLLELSRQAVGASVGDAAKAKAIEGFLRARYAYSTFSDSRGRSLSSFLFGTRKGNCEYFASAGVVLMREAGIPARLVTGFLADDWNEYGGFYDVRQRTAHAWVEAYLPTQGWTTFDPTPTQSAFSFSADALSRRLERLIDAVQGEWYRTVIGYDQSSQRNTFTRIGVALSLTAALAWLRKLFLAGAAAWALWGIWSLLRQARERLERGRRLGLYGRAEQLLLRAGLPRPAHLTPREFSIEVRGRRPELAGLCELAELHYRERYAGLPLEPSEAARAQRLLRELGSRL
ncbi:MAG: DUF3488 domain-containing protein [Elusimicrobia bacterium]|nr:DUF3488 domain-containing protein [Elusimicrobiota bacterium]